MKTKQGSPSGVGSRIYAATKFKPISLTELGFSQSVLRLLMVLLVLPMAWVSAWAGGSFNTWLRASTDDTAKGLVYASKTQNQTPANSSYKETVLSESVSGKKNTPQNFYGWAKPARGYAFSTWTGYTYAGDGAKEGEGAATFPSPKQTTGSGDLIYSKSWNGDAGSDQANSVKASWAGATAYTVTYKEPDGGNYSVEYSYLTINNSAFVSSSETLNLSPGSGDKRPYGISDGSQEGKSYATDVVTLTSDATNFIGWYEDGVWKSDGTGANHSYTYPITKNANVVGMFKSATLSVAENEIKILSTSSTADNHVNLVVNVDAVGGWSVEDFAVTRQNESGSGTISIGTLSYSAGTLTIPVTYNANGHFSEGTSVELHIGPTVASYGAEVVVTVNGLAEEVFDYEARVLDGEDVKTTGTVAEALAYINDRDWEDAPTLQLVQKNDNQEYINATSVLRVKKSMILDLNSKVLKSTTLDNLILVQGNTASDKVNLTITDNSYLKTGEIDVKKSANAVVEAIKVADANKLTMKYVKVHAENTATFASNANAKAYGVHIAGTGNVIISKKANAEEPDVRIFAESDHAAYGVFAESGYATFHNVAITADANVDAYAFYSNATSNISDATLTAATATGANAYATYIAGGTAIMDRVAMTTTSATTAAYGANVAAGRLVMNGGSVSATAASSVFGVCVQSGATANIQVKTNIEATSTTGADAYGVRNLGTLTLNNITVIATSATNKATAVESITSAASTTIEDGTYTAISATGSAYGLHHQYGTLNVDGGTFSGEAADNSVYGGRAAVNATIANATFSGETTGSGNTAYGFVSGVAGKNISLTNCTIKAKSATTKAYAIYSRANTTATGCTLEAKANGGAYAYGLLAENGNNVLTNTNAVIDAYTTDAYGIDYQNGSLQIEGGEYSIKARQATASGAGDTRAYGIKVADAKTVTLNNASFTVIADNGSLSQNVYGAYTGTGTINSTGCSYIVSGAKQVYGVYGASSSTLNLQNNTISAKTVGSTDANGIYSAGYFTINGDDVTSDTKSYSSYTLFFTSDAQGEVLGGKFMAKGISTKSTQIIAPINTDGNADYVKVKGGFFSDNVRLRYFVPTTHDIYGVDPNAPEYAQKYYYTVNDHLPYENVCYITEVSTGYPTLEEAFDYARNHSGTNYNIVMTQPYTLPAGNYSLPSNATLLVPDRVSRTKAIGTTAERQYPDEDIITENRCLTFAAGANLDVYGKIEVSAKQYITNVTNIAFVLGPYGRIHLENGSTITLNNGAKINAWGYITGQGEIRVKSGAEVREFFQIHDMAAASAVPDWTSSTNKNTYKAFLMNQYYIQSIEAPTKYYYGGKLIGSLGITGNATASLGTGLADNVQLVGTSGAFFSVDTDNEASWVRKTYDPTTDRILWETNSSASLGAIDISMGSYGFNSKDYVLPFTNNMTVHALSGLLNITQNVVLLPGSVVEVDKTATLHINAKDLDNKAMGLYLYDKSQWSADAKPVKYSPSWVNGACPRDLKAANMKDAAIYVKGKIEVEGALYTTAGGAAIYSDNINAGTIEFNANAAADGTLYKKYDGSVSVPVTAAKLRNGGETGPDANMTITKGNASAGDTYAYTNIDGTGFKWAKLTTVDDCIIAVETDSEHPVYYAKPQGYVAITSNIEDSKHLFYSVEGEGDTKKKFINMPTDAGCQWWEVTATATAGVYYCATNGTYYKYNSESWEEYTVEVTFYRNEEGTVEQKVLTVNYGATPDVSIVSNPSKAEDDAATYQFYGWKSSKTETEYSYTAELETVTEDMYYLPVFTSITKKYTITFNNAKNGANVPVEVFYGEHPTYSATKDATAQYTYYFQYWLDSDGVTQYAIDAELPTVTGATYYTAVWTQTVNKYSIIWKNGDDVLETDTKQEYGTATAYNGAKPTKEMDNNFVYDFSGWLSSLTGQTYANGSTPTVAGETTYEAQYTMTPRYKVTFANYDGTPLQQEYVTAGEQPIYKGLTPGRARDLDGYFRFIGWKNSEGTDYAPNATLPAVTGKETYTAQYDYVTELYLITLNNVDGAGASWSGKFGVGSTPFYNRDNNDVAVEPTQASTTQYEYPFLHWLDVDNNEYALNALPEVSKAATYTAVFDEGQLRTYDITFDPNNGIDAPYVVNVSYGVTPSTTDPTKGDNYFTYAFTGWSPALSAVTGEATYTAQFSSTGTPRTFPITFDPDNGVDAPYIVNVAYGETPTPAVPATWQDAANTYTFSGWNPAIHAVDGPAEYTAQYTPTLRTFTIRFVNYDGTELRTSVLAYGTTPVPPTNMTKPANFDTKKMYNFNGWSPAIASVTGDATYTAQYTEQNLAATVTIGDVTTPYTSWDQAYGNRANNCIMKLYANVTPGNNYRAIDRDMTIDLNGYTLSGTGGNSNSQLLTVSKALTIIDSRESGQDGKVSYTGSGRYTYTTINISGNGASLTLNGGIIEATNTRTTNSNNGSTAARAVATESSAALTINSGELKATSTYGTAYAVNNNNTNVTITGGKLKATLNGSTSSGSAYLFNGSYVNKVTASAATETSYFSKDPGSITVVDGYEKRSPSGLDGYTHKVVRVYTVTFQNRGGAVLQNTPKYEAGEIPTYSGETPTYYTSEGTKLYTFRAWKAEGDENEYTTSFPAVIGAITYVAQYDELEQLEVEDNTPIEKDIEVTNTVVSTTGVLNTNGHTLTTTNLILEAGVDVSGQIADGSNVSVSGNVYYDLKLNTDARHWHAFGVPWAVDVTANPLTEVETGRTLVVGRDCEVVYYNGATRAAQGAGSHCWEYLKHYNEAGQPVDVMTPGKGYMIAFTSAVQTVRFTKASDAPIFFSGSNSVVGGAGEDGGWNAIANPMAYHATLNAGPTVGYVHDGGEIGSDGYTPYDINGTKYIVGKTVYVQAALDASIVVNPAGSAGDMTEILAAPKRTKDESVATDKQYLALGDYYTVSLTNANGVGSKVYVLPEEDKADEYVIGHDLSQFSMSTKKPQVWVNRYDTKLALNTTAPVNGAADFPISLYAPVAGEYTITNDQSPMTNEEEYTVYLTLDGEAIWNLSSSAYALSLSKGTVSNYGIRISAKVPQVATGMDEAVIDAQGETRKVLINDKVYIIRGENVYSVDGQLVK